MTPCARCGERITGDMRMLSFTDDRYAHTGCVTPDWTDDGLVTASDISFAAWLGGLTADLVNTDRAVHMQPSEIALMALPRGTAA